ncbi:MAG: GNAT family N-acetyltransferase [Sphingomonas bacterium]|nr:GNAT family N-acetyltransferase [Sphingomonas bacterium]
MSSASQPSLPVRLDPGNSNDLDGVMAIMTTAFDPGFGEGWSRSQCAGIMPLLGVIMTIARDELGQARGFALQRSIVGESELLLLAVHRSAQGCGIGGQLLDHFVDTGRASGATRLHLEVRDGNPATAMYQAFGFVAEGRRSNYYRGSDGRLFDAVTMVLDLNRE